ncbi:MAG: hypothetical protein ACP5OU_03470 [Methanothrix sp.]
MKINLLHLIIIVVFAVSSNVSGAYWSSSISGNLSSSQWTIYRESNNISFDLSSYVDGRISPVESLNRVLYPYMANYAEIKANDVKHRERINALEGNYRSEDEITLRSTVYPYEIDIFVNKPVGTEIHIIEYENEIWPVFMKSRKALTYSGLQINDRNFEGNNGDYVGANFLRNQDLSKEQRCVIWLQKMNATVLATNDSILSAELQPDKYLGYTIQAKTTGLSDLSYKLRDSQYDVRHQNYPSLIEGEERYYGKYELTRRIEMRSIFEKYNNTDEADWQPSWLPCCFEGWNDIWKLHESNLGTNPEEVFDCTYSKEKTKV